MAPGRRGFNLHDLIFSRAHAEAAAICPQQLAEIGARYGATVLRGAALGATSAAAFLTQVEQLNWTKREHFSVSH